MSRICIVMGGQLSTCPRLLKAADSLAQAGHDVCVVSTLYIDWASETDRIEMATRRWTWDPVDLRPIATRLEVGLRRHGARALVRRWPTLPVSISAHAHGRGHARMVDTIVRRPFDLVYGGTSSGIGAAVAAARRARVPFGLDLEDLYAEEHGAQDPVERVVVERILEDAAPTAAFLTASSAPIADAYVARLGRRPDVLHNVFVRPSAPRRRTLGTVPRISWFSQTIGRGRGLELALHALGLVGSKIELTLRGRPSPGYRAELEALRGRVAAHTTLRWHEPVAPGVLLEALQDADIGLALEPGHPGNNELALSNKALTYPLLGMPLAITDTPGQRALIESLGEAAIVVPTERAAPLAERAATMAHGLTRWLREPERYARACAQSWHASEIWSWQHEEGRLLALVDRALAEA